MQYELAVSGTGTMRGRSGARILSEREDLSLHALHGFDDASIRMGSSRMRCLPCVISYVRQETAQEREALYRFLA